MARLGLLLLLCFSVACGDGTLGPSDPDGLTLGNFEVRSAGVYGFGTLPPFIYNACGGIGTARNVDAVTIQSFEVAIRNDAGREFLHYSVPGYPTSIGSGGLFGCFGGPLDTDPSRPPGTSFRIRVTYTRHGDRRAVEVTGPVTAAPIVRLP